jgi:hypothetical protein
VSRRGSTIQKDRRHVRQIPADQANVRAYIDRFMILGFAVLGALLLMLFLQPKPRERETGMPA